MSRLANLEAFVASQPDHLSRLGQLLRVDILLCRQFERELVLREPSPANFFQTMELLTLQVQHLAPELTQKFVDYHIFLDCKTYNLLEALSLYHCMGVLGAYNKPSHNRYVTYYLQNVRPHYHKLVSDITGEVGLTLPVALSPQVKANAEIKQVEEVPF